MVKTVLLSLLLLALAAIPIRRLLARSNTQVHRIN
jgi:hypothetical protein